MVTMFKKFHDASLIVGLIVGYLCFCGMVVIPMVNAADTMVNILGILLIVPSAGIVCSFLHKIIGGYIK